LNGKPVIKQDFKKYNSTEHSKVNKTVPEKVATTRTEDGQK